MASLFSSSVSSSIMIFLSFFLLFCCHCYADSNDLAGSTCSSNPSEAESSSWTANLNILSSKLEANVILNNGYYKAEAGEKGPDKVYGLIQCRGDISKSNCTDCTRESFNSRNSSCDNDGRSKSVVIWHNWCLLQYSNASFYGVWEKSHFSVSWNNSSLDEEPGVVAKGRTMMMGLTAAAPKESLMFAKAEIDDGKGGKRYGLAQCTRDLGKSDCGDCLEYLIGDSTFMTTVVDQRSWGIYGTGCFMLYSDAQFNSAEDGLGGARPPNAANRDLVGRLATAITIFMAAIVIL